MLLISTTQSIAQNRQYKIEAAFLYSFFNYITWPGYHSPQALRNPIICIYGQDPILQYLEYVRQKMASERSITIRTIQPGDTTKNCHLFFMRHRVVPSSATPADSTLTVFKPDDPLDRGGMIELAEDEERLTLRINHRALEQNGFQASSRLLELAQRVR